ncbi:MAG: hypothetical protein HZB38_08480, partial [Planctomycetes bacterium]|nr:hypothetical protein [Planctomycetota bacterium]
QLADQSAESPAEDQADASNAGGESHVVAVVDEALRTHPLVRLYVLDQTRPIVMGMSAGLLAAAIVLLGRNASARAPVPPPEKA